MQPDSRQPVVRGRRGSSGFTLLEVLVSLSLFSLLTYTAYSGLQTGARTWEVGNERTEALADLRVVRGFARRYLGGAFPLLLEDDGGENFIGFEGDARSVSFYTEMPPHLGAGGVYAMRLWLEREGELTHLKMSRQLLGARDRGPLGGIGGSHNGAAAYYTERSIAERLVDGRFGYFGAGAPDEDPRWRDTWTDRAAMPLAVSIRLSNEDGPWPEMVMRMRLHEPRRLAGETEPAGDQQGEDVPADDAGAVEDEAPPSPDSESE